MRITRYRNGISDVMLKDYSDNVKSAMSLTHCGKPETKKASIKEYIRKFGNHENDHGNAAVQACISCEEVLSLVDHLRENIHDMTAKVHLERKLKKRKVALKYLMRKNYAQYCEILQLFNIPIGVGVPLIETFKKERMYIGCEGFDKKRRGPLLEAAMNRIKKDVAYVK